MSQPFDYFTRFDTNDGSSTSIIFATPITGYPVDPIAVNMTFNQFDYDNITDIGVFLNDTTFQVNNPGLDEIDYVTFGGGTTFQYGVRYDIEDYVADYQLYITTPLVFFPSYTITAIVTYDDESISTNTGLFLKGYLFNTPLTSGLVPINIAFVNLLQYGIEYQTADGNPDFILLQDSFETQPLGQYFAELNYNNQGPPNTSGVGIFLDNRVFQINNPGRDDIASITFYVPFQYGVVYSVDDSYDNQILFANPFGGYSTNIIAVRLNDGNYQNGIFLNRNTFNTNNNGGILNAIFYEFYPFEYNVQFPVNDFDIGALYFSPAFTGYPPGPIKTTIYFNDFPPYETKGTFTGVGDVLEISWPEGQPSYVIFTPYLPQASLTWFFSPVLV